MLSRILGGILKALLPFLNRGEEEPVAEEAPTAPAPHPFAEALALFQAQDYAAAATAFQEILTELQASSTSVVWREARQYLLLCYIQLNREPDVLRLLSSAEPPTFGEPAEKLAIENDWQVVRAWFGKRTRQLRNYWWATFLFVLILLVVSFSEGLQLRRPGELLWWHTAWLRLAQQWDTLVANYPATVWVLLVGLVLMIFGARWILFIDDWLRGLWQWSLKHPSVSGGALVVVILVLFSAISNANSWSFNAVEVWSEELLAQSGQEVEVLFRTSLNSVGTEPFASIPVQDPQAPMLVTRAQETFQQLTLADCPAILAERISFTPNPRRNVIVVSQLSTVQDRRGTGDPVRLPTAVGTFNLPLDNVTRLLFRYFVPNYRELNAQIIPAPQRPGFIRLVVVSSPNDQRWLAEGPSDGLSQLINFMAARIALDWTYQQTGQPSDLVASQELAFALGTQAYIAGDLKEAQIYYDLAAFYQDADPNIQLMRGLTHLQRQDAAGGADPAEIALALRAMERASQLASGRMTLSPYLACLYSRQQRSEPAEAALAVFNEALEEAATAARAATARREALAALPVLGRGERLFLVPSKRDPEALDVYYSQGETVRVSLGWEPGAALTTTRIVDLGDTTRHLFATDEGVFVVSSDGLVVFYNPFESRLISIISADELNFAPINSVSLTAIQAAPMTQAAPGQPEASNLNMGGVRQVVVRTVDNRKVMFVLDRFGRVHRMALDVVGAQRTYVARREAVLLDAAAQQITVDGTTLYFLKDDGTIWQIPNALTGELVPARILDLTRNRQMSVFQGSIFVLRDDSTIWHFRPGAAAAAVQIDDVPGTRRVTASEAGLFVLKDNGKIWQITNPGAPLYPDDFRLLDESGAGTRLDMFVFQTRVFALNGPPGEEQVIPYPARMPSTFQSSSR